MKLTPEPVRDIDDIVATNILRLRTNEKGPDARRPRPDSEGWSRPTLAKRLTDLTGQRWSEARILDLEGRRKPRRPSPAKWAELVALALAFDVPIYELVLPLDGDITIARPDPGIDHEYTVTADEYSKLLFRLPRKSLHRDVFAAAAVKLNHQHHAYKIDRLREGIENLLAELDKETAK